MNRDGRQFILAACFAITAHAALWAYSSRVADREGRIGFAQAQDASPTVAAAPPVIVLPPPEVETPPPNAIGETGGVGESISTDETPSVAKSDVPPDFEQAWTRRKPVPLPPKSAEGSPTNSDAVEPESKAKKIPPPSFGPLSVIGRAPVVAPPLEEKAVSPNDAPMQPLPERKTDGDAEKTVEAPRASEAETATAQPTPPVVQADPAKQGESDLDPFAKEESITFAPGGSVAREGREVKLARPRVDLGFMADATRITGDLIAVRMDVKTDATGHPRDVRVLDSSGSAVIDDAVRLAMFDSWFGGKMPDRFPFTVRFVRR